MWKGVDREYDKNLTYLKSIDLSSSKLSGEIPVEITTLEGLRSLNLSRNSLTGPITPKIGNLNLLDSLALSRKIPFNTKLQSVDAHEYAGNPKLCESPLPNKCLEAESPTTITRYEDNEDGIVTPEFFICAAIGFTVGFRGILGSLILNRSLRHAYLEFLNQTKDRLYVAMVLNIAKLQRWPTTRS
ncbi:hypothetical protein Dsin_012992 [Dipteronia sinensis]|uniref:Uncharacterized protein n=1 Tax=Dipteronia sinensis TaxID=43782 RepID=A0AAE0E902_9ROSI|nr:hypothetical protein Dsin_012992 [Dipteronia sinensis]